MIKIPVVIFQYPGYFKTGVTIATESCFMPGPGIQNSTVSAKFCKNPFQSFLYRFRSEMFPPPVFAAEKKVQAENFLRTRIHSMPDFHLLRKQVNSQDPFDSAGRSDEIMMIRTPGIINFPQLVQ